jgi:flavin reductase (DIM6/NTAB) family NADH-FMN oxidoreductase RutF
MNKPPVRQRIDPSRLRVSPHDLFNRQWLLLASGDFAARKFNCMTIAWGSMGTMWNRPFVQVVVRPQRHTYLFMEAYDSFTLSAFRPALRPALQLLGSKSGRDGDKLAEAGLTPQSSTLVDAPSFVESDLAIECRKLYAQDLDPKGFNLPALNDNYATGDYHRIYFGEIVAVHAIDAHVA